MTLPQAIVIREKQLCGYAVPPLLLREAIEIIKKTMDQRKAGRPLGTKDSKPRAKKLG